MIHTGILERTRCENFSGSTIFAPTNSEFAFLGRLMISFLFSKLGEKSLRTILQYHIVLNEILFSIAYCKTYANEIKEKF